MIGNFIVYEYPRGDDNPRDIAFQLREDVSGAVPRQQASLKSDVEKTLVVLRKLFSPSDETFKRYFSELLALSRYGLIGQSAQPVQAAETLKNLQTQIFDNEKGRAISAYMRELIVSGLIWIGGLALALLVCGGGIGYKYHAERNLMLYQPADWLTLGGIHKSPEK